MTFAHHDQTIRVAVLGPLGTYTHEAAHKVFGDSVDYEEQTTISGMNSRQIRCAVVELLTYILDTLRAVQETAPIGVVPQENTIFGNVIETYDELRQADCCFVKGEVTLQIQHCLLVQRGVQLHEIEKVLSHEQALGQCQDYLDAKLPNATRVKASSTASAAQALLTSPRNYAAICSKVCATIFDGLEILKEGIQKETDNYTRFYIVVRDRDVQLPATAPHRPKSKALIRLWISSSRPSGLQRQDVIQFLAPSGLNVTRIDRRPSDDGLPFRDIYFVETASTPDESLRPEGTSAIRSWPAVVADALELIKNMGGEVDLIGLW
ncbi:P-protein [Leucoagaricus sp. SymC.cos]|nr:P-protein [Leucoagaricus sp. SymC.cos]